MLEMLEMFSKIIIKRTIKLLKNLYIFKLFNIYIEELK